MIGIIVMLQAISEKIYVAINYPILNFEVWHVYIQKMSHNLFEWGVIEQVGSLILLFIYLFIYLSMLHYLC